MIQMSYPFNIEKLEEKYYSEIISKKFNCPKDQKNEDKKNKE